MSRYIISICFVMLLVISGYSQSGNDTTIQNQQNGFVEDFARFFTYETNKFSISTYPSFNYSPEKGFGIGVTPIIRIIPDSTKTTNEYYRPTTLIPYLMVYTNGSVTFSSDFVVFTNNGWSLYNKFKFADYPTSFYGVGAPSFDSLPINYEASDLLLIGELAKAITSTVFAGVRFDFHKQTNSNFDTYTPLDDVPGFEGGWNTGLGPVVQFDSRDDILYPQKGWFITGFSIFNTKVLGGDYKFNGYKLDIRKYFELPGIENIIALQYSNTITTGDIPFYKMPGLGGSTKLRGISHAKKFVDKNQWILQAEYRKHIYWRIGATAFVGTGSVYEQSSGYFEDIQACAGLGLRVRIVPNDRLNFRLDYGLASNGDKALYMTIREAF